MLMLLDKDKRVSVLDGVRGLAICLVFLYHFTPDYTADTHLQAWANKLAHCGWTGVDLFFVLSGLLITDILLRSRGTNYAARAFYLRRALRIMPLYLLSLVFVFAVLPWLVPPGTDPRFDALRGPQALYWLHCANIVAFVHGFPAMMSDTVHLSHFWSLAVEEHFYLFWPLLVWNLSERRLLAVAAALMVAACACRCVGVMLCPETTQAGFSVLTSSRMDALTLGAMLAMLSRRVQAHELRRLAWCLLPVAAIPLLSVFVLEKGLWPGSTFVRTIGFSLVALCYASFIVVLTTAHQAAPMVRIIDNPVLRFFGKYSYGLYIIHGLFAPLLERLVPTEYVLQSCTSPILGATVIVGAKTALSTVGALLSWHLVEEPVLRLKRYFAYDKPRLEPLARGAGLRHADGAEVGERPATCPAEEDYCLRRRPSGARVEALFGSDRGAI